MLGDPNFLGKLPLTALVLSVLFCFACGLGLFFFGRRLPREGDWLAGFAFVVLLGVLGWNIHESQALSSSPAAFMRGWIWPREEKGAITIGFLRDLSGLSSSALLSLVGALGVLEGAASRGRDGSGSHRISSGALIGASGAVLAWISATAWLVFVGAAVAALGGVFALSGEVGSEGEAEFVARLAWERAWGISVAVIGALSLAALGARLVFSAPEALGAGDAGRGATALLLGGVFLLFQVVPMLGWSVKASAAPFVPQILLGKVFPVWTVFALLYRMEPALRESGIYPVFGWITLAAATLSALSGLIQSDWKQAGSVWVSVGFALAASAQALGGPAAGLPLLVSVTLGGVGVALAGGILEEGGGSGASHRLRGTWTRAALLSCVVAASGTFGFVGCGGAVLWVEAVLGVPVFVAPVGVAILLFTLLGWKTAWTALRKRNAASASWVRVLSPLALSLMALGVFWWGSLSGGGIPGGSDQVMGSLLRALLGAGTEGTSPTAIWILVGVSLLAFAAGFWSSARKQDAWKQFHRAAPRSAAFIGGGYGADPAGRRVFGLLLWAARGLEDVLDRRIWNEVIPGAGTASVGMLSGLASDADAWLSEALTRLVRRTVEVPAKLLQLIQSGNVQWYLFFAIGSGIAILIHFLRT